MPNKTRNIVGEQLYNVSEAQKLQRMVSRKRFFISQAYF
jgi:hypothetical protein